MGWALSQDLTFNSRWRLKHMTQTHALEECLGINLRSGEPVTTHLVCRLPNMPPLAMLYFKQSHAPLGIAK
jgi:hypothetical protein